MNEIKRNSGMFKPGQGGRKRGSKNKMPDAKAMAKLLDHIVQDMTVNYDKLTVHQKLRILTSFTRLFEQENNVIEIGDKIRFDFGKED